jgi:glycosyltransferase involved in cell wall biosynthesis
MSHKITIGITTYFSYDWVVKQLNLNYLDALKEIVDEIVIQDDCSDDYEKLKQYESLNIKVFRNQQNLSPLLNRIELLKNCKNDWVLLMDSDNTIKFKSECGLDWVNVVKGFNLNNKSVIYSPGFKTHPGYVNIMEKDMDLNFFKKHIDDPGYYLKMLGNTGNYLVPRDKYLEVSSQIDNKYCHYIGEVLYFNYLWLKNGNTIQCKDDFEYNHVIRQDGYTITNFNKSQNILQEILNLFK